ncbi:hypothetical protein AB0O14_18990 [Microbacterium foliorum]|uniref:ParB family protein n=1 Tax=Rothia terrae TaxID=396015 RepID=UPI0034318ED2
MSNKNTPRQSNLKSIFNSGEHPVRAQVVPPVPPVEANEPLETAVSEKQGQRSQGAKKPSKAKKEAAKKENSNRERMSIYGSSDELNRFRAAFARTAYEEGYESLSDFIFKAASKEAARLEKKYNNGERFEGVSRIGAGRPVRR